MTMYFFPTPYKDELLYSILARYCIQSGNANAIQNFDDMFGTRNIIASIELSGKLSALIENMPLNTPYTSDCFIFKHTLFPFLASFVPKERAKEVIENMKDGDVSKAYNMLGLTASNIIYNRYFRFCPECMKEDIKIYGETYWHRIHQVTGVFICPEHKEPLHDSTVLMRGANRQAYISATIDNCLVKEVDSFSEDTFKKLLWIAEDIQTILNKEFTFQSLKKHKYIYMEKLIEKGFANLNTMVHQRKLRKAIYEFWGEEVLQMLQSPIDCNKDCHWINSLVRDNKITSQPIRHLLVARALGLKAIDLLDNQSYINIEKDHKEQWEDKLIELCKQDLSIREIAIALDSTPKTIRKNIDKLGIEPFWKYNGGGMFIYQDYRDMDDFKIRQKNARERWLDLMKKNPKLSRNNLKKLDEGVYTWLIRHDNEWLDNNAPTIKNQYKPIDWNQRDEELLPQVKEVVIRMQEGKPERIRWTTLGGKLGINGWFSKRKDKLPKVKAYLDSIEETLQDFHIRKIKWTIEELESEGVSISKWKLIEKSGVNARYIADIKDRVSQVLREKGYDEDLLS
ncbi:TnsD family Tn7-like transposition protein [Tissierella sp.]|uniref:TnsD family Tn7-like transposition protein n=1 Tax=Tissierella sp. TaxID=41274 RepID=UPI0030206A72